MVEQKSGSSRRSRKQHLLLWLGGIFLVSLGGGLSYGYFLLQQRLTPLIDKELTNLLNRPVEVGQVNGVSFTGVRLGQSAIPATKVDPDRLTAKGVDVAFNLLTLLTHRELNLNVTLIEPNLYLEQDEQKNWLSTKLDSSTGESTLKVNLQTIRFKDADLTLIARSKTGQKPSVQASIPSGTTTFLNNAKLIQFDLAGRLLKGGKFQVNGSMLTPTDKINLVVQGNQMAATAVGNLIELPFTFRAGTIGSNLEVQLKQGRISSLDGLATLQNVTAQFPNLARPFEQTKGQLRFQGSQIRLEDFSGLFGSVPMVANGVVDQGTLEITAQTASVEVNRAIEALKLNSPPVPVAGEIAAAIALTGANTQPKVDIDVATTKPSQVDRVNFRRITADLELINSNLVVEAFQAEPTVGGRLTGQGEVKLKTGNYRFNVLATNVPGQPILRPYATLPINPGLVSGNARIDGNLKNQTMQGLGAVQFPLGGGTVTASNIQVAARRWQADVRTSDVQLSSLSFVPPQWRERRLNGVFDVSGTVDSFSPETIRATGEASIRFAEGVVRAKDLQIADGRWTTQLQAQALELQQVVPQASIPGQLARWGERRLNGVFDVSGTVDSFSPETIRATGEASIRFADGVVRAKDLQIADGRWTTQLQAQALELQQVVPQASTPGQLSGTFNLAGSLEDLTLEGIRGDGTGEVAIADGSVKATEIQFEQGSFRAVVVPDALPLETFSAELQGRLGGKLNVTGRLDNISPTVIQADGQVALSQGLPLVERPLTATVNWNGRRLVIDQATARGLQAQGSVDVNPRFFTQGQVQSGIDQFNLDVEAEDINLRNLPIPVPQALASLDYSGEVDFAGSISGTAAAPQINGQLALQNFAVETLAFEPMLAGTLQVTPQAGVDLNLAGTSDRLRLNLSADNQPQEFSIKFDETVVNGFSQGERLRLTTENVPIASLKDLANALNAPLPDAVATQTIAGELSGDFTLNPATLAVDGEIAIAQPAIGRLKGDRFTGNVAYANNQLILRKGLFLQGESRYRLDGRFDQSTGEPQFQAQVNVDQGQVQDILETLEIFELSDLSRGLKAAQYGNSADLYRSEEAAPPTQTPLFSVGSPGATVENQLRRLSEVETQLEQERQQREAALLPELASLQGSFDGTIEVNGLASGVEAQFELQGQQWQWGPYTAEQVIAQGTFDDGVFTLVPIRLQSDDRFVNFSGSFGGETQSGQLRLANIPVDLLQKFVKLPPAIGIDGQANARVAIAGSRENPQARGELTVENATINQTSIQSTQGSFSYNNARLNFFASSILAEGAEPSTIDGSFPYQLPFAAVQPDSNQLNLNLNVQDEGLALLDILTRNKVNWVAGQGAVNLDISGTFDQDTSSLSQLRAEGIARVDQATIAAQVLPEALTQVSGTVLFNFDRLEVESLTGKVGGGEVLVAGALPLTQSTPQNQPLTVTLRNSTFDFQELYQGGVEGEVQVTGSALAPNLSGEVELSQGEVLLGEAANGSAIGNGEGLASQINFNRLRLKLGKAVRLRRPPILDFLASGSLIVNGTLDNPRPEGTIRLQRGQVNLFTTQFQLAGGEANTAQFSSERGLDPYLDVDLVTSVVETNPTPSRLDPFSADIREITPSQFGLQTVRVEAQIEGYASQLNEHVELTSSPPRTQTEIVALLGGSFVDPLGRGDPTLGLANLAGSALFGSFQGAIGEALGLSEFRVFPTSIINEEERTTTLGLAAEASIDLTEKLSFSALKILNTEQPAQFGIRYRLNERTVLRGSTDFEQDSRATVEYEQRF